MRSCRADLPVRGLQEIRPGLLLSLAGWICARILVTLLALRPRCKPAKARRPQHVDVQVFSLAARDLEFHSLEGAATNVPTSRPPALCLLAEDTPDPFRSES